MCNRPYYYVRSHEDFYRVVESNLKMPDEQKKYIGHVGRFYYSCYPSEVELIFADGETVVFAAGNVKILCRCEINEESPEYFSPDVLPKWFQSGQS